MGNWLWSGLAQSSPNMDAAFLIDKIARVPISKIVIFAAVLTIVRLVLFKFLKDTPVHQRQTGYQIAKFGNDIADALIYAAIVVFMLVRPFGIQTFFIPSESMTATLRIGDYIVANKFIYRASEPKPGDIVVFKPVEGTMTGDAAVADLIKRCQGGPGDIIQFDGFQLIRNGQKIQEPYKVLTTTDPNTRKHDLVLTPEETATQTNNWEGPDLFMPPKFKFIEEGGEVKPMFYDDREGSEPRAIVYLTVDTKRKDYVGSSAREMISKPAAAIPKDMFLMVGDNRNGSNDGRFWGLVPRDNIIGKAEFTWMPLARAKKLANHEALHQDQK